MLFLFVALIVILIVLFIPCLIVLFWKKRPLLAFVIATLVMFLTLIASTIIKTFQAMMIYGEGDPQLMAGEISNAIVRALLWMIICVPLLWFFQWFALRRHRGKLPKVDTDKTFS